MHEPGMPVSIEIDGKEYPIRFSLRTLKVLQKDHGIALMKGGSADLLDPERLAIVLYHGLREGTPDVTLDWVEDHVDTATLIAMIPHLTLAISGKAPTAPPNAPTPALTGIGSPSGASDDTTSGLVNGRSGV